MGVLYGSFPCLYSVVSVAWLYRSWPCTVSSELIQPLAPRSVPFLPSVLITITVGLDGYPTYDVLEDVEFKEGMKEYS